MADSQIRWKRGDYITLGRAVSQFNKKINELKSEENALYLPEEITYNDLKGEILTRKELNRKIKSLKSFLLEDATDIIELSSGEKVTKWEKQELSILARTASRRLQKELSSIDKIEKPYTTQEEIQINAQLKNLKNWQNKSGFEFKKMKERLYSIGVSDYEMRKANIFRENYLNSMKEAYGNFENFEILESKLKTIKNPKSFYDFIKKSEYLSDLFLYYDDESGTLVYGGLGSNEDIFNSELEKLDLL